MQGHGAAASMLICNCIFLKKTKTLESVIVTFGAMFNKFSICYSHTCDLCLICCTLLINWHRFKGVVYPFVLCSCSVGPISLLFLTRACRRPSPCLVSQCCTAAADQLRPASCRRRRATPVRRRLCCSSTSPLHIVTVR